MKLRRDESSPSHHGSVEVCGNGRWTAAVCGYSNLPFQQLHLHFPMSPFGLNMLKRLDMIPYEEIHLTSSVNAFKNEGSAMTASLGCCVRQRPSGTGQELLKLVVPSISCFSVGLNLPLILYQAGKPKGNWSIILRNLVQCIPVIWSSFATERNTILNPVGMLVVWP